MLSLTTTVLEPDEVESLLRTLDEQQFEDGRRTASGIARQVKRNLEMAPGAAYPDMEKTVLAALERNTEFQRFAFPRKVFPPIFSRYTEGMEYGRHIDGALMGGALVGGAHMRTDFSMTVFLSDPASYDGGELVLELPAGQRAVKLRAGRAILYPAGAIHRVAPVTRGVRTVAVTWVQSAIRDERLRGMLLELREACGVAESAGDADQLLRLTKIYNDLVRYAAEV
jgi:PKHD-type hydroxylase